MIRMSFELLSITRNESEVGIKALMIPITIVNDGGFRGLLR